SLSTAAAPTAASPLSLHDALPISGFERQKIVERIGDGGRRARSAAHHDAALGEPLALPAQFFAFPASDRAIEIADASVLGGEQRSEEHTSELQSRVDLVCRLLLEK